MGTIYQPSVLIKTEDFILALEESLFFEDYEITDYSYARKYLNDYLTQKFIDGELDDDNFDISEEEFEKILQNIAAGSLLESLVNMGYLDSIEDVNNEEMFFLTDLGKKELKNLSGDNSTNLEGV
jgi:hypothetical protein